ncbi:MAG: HD domain-containing protein [Spirochaetales bacterium]|nr:HD domain-containing protein [Spirochaetales bacterium]
MTDKTKWIQVRNSNLKYYEGVELYYKSPSSNIVLYKPEGMKFNDESLDKKYIDDLYIRPKDKIKCLRAAQKGFSEGLVSNIVKHDTVTVKNELVNLVDETLSQPRSGGLETAPGLIDDIISGYSSQPDVVKNLARISFTDYTTTIHSINVMALTVGYCFYNHMTEEETRQFGLAALLHDVGKTEIPGEILAANRGLTDLEFIQMKKHPSIGFDILRFTGIDIKVATEGALEHHEKLDGSGYPEGKTKISECGMLLGIIDCYEAITNDDRPYRSAMQPMAALQILKGDVDNGKYDKKIFETFAYSLTDFNRSGKYKDFF